MDRNNCKECPYRILLASLSARRAWIEISVSTSMRVIHVESLSARRAWIEIMKEYTQYKVLRVALRKESVDRNYDLFEQIRHLHGRSPQGERG